MTRNNFGSRILEWNADKAERTDEHAFNISLVPYSVFVTLSGVEGALFIIHISLFPVSATLLESRHFSLFVVHFHLARMLITGFQTDINCYF